MKQKLYNDYDHFPINRRKQEKSPSTKTLKGEQQKNVCLYYDEKKDVPCDWRYERVCVYCLVFVVMMVVVVVAAVVVTDHQRPGQRKLSRPIYKLRINLSTRKQLPLDKESSSSVVIGDEKKIKKRKQKREEESRCQGIQTHKAD